MKTYISEKTEHTVTLGIQDINITMVAPLLDRLNANPDVELARFLEPHPELEDRSIYVQVSKGDPLDAIKKALDEIAEYFSTGYASTENNKKIKYSSKENDSYRVDGDSSDSYRVDGDSSDSYRVDGDSSDSYKTYGD